MRRFTIPILTVLLFAAIAVGLIHSQRYWSMIEENESAQDKKKPESAPPLKVANSAPEKIKRNPLPTFVSPEKNESSQPKRVVTLQKLKPPKLPPEKIKREPLPTFASTVKKKPTHPKPVAALQKQNQLELPVNKYKIRTTPPPTPRRKKNEPIQVASVSQKQKSVPPALPMGASFLEQAQKALREGIDPAGAVALAKSIPENPNHTDAAFLLLEYAAESGNPQAALAVGHFYDPIHTESGGSIRKNPETAYEWYQTALAKGQKEAEKRLTKLHQWAEKEASKGNSQAKDLLKNWQ